MDVRQIAGVMAMLAQWIRHQKELQNVDLATTGKDGNHTRLEKTTQLSQGAEQ